MCYAIPGRVESIDANIATVDYFGQRKKAINEIEGLKRGDYIYAQGGYVIEKIPRTEAEDILSTWRETFFELQELDVKFSRLGLEKNGIDKKLGHIIDKALEERGLTREELLYLLSLDDPKELDILFKAANFLRQKYHRNACCVHGIIEISNHCGRNCHYCGISSANTGLKRYRMSVDEIVDAACEAINGLNFKALVLQSGEGAGYSASELASIIKKIKARAAALIFISFGEMPREDLETLFHAGARGILLRFETSNPSIYEKLHPGYRLETRLETLKAAAKIGYLVITGGLIGLPGQSREDILNDLYLTKELDADMFSFGPFIPHPDTCLAGLRSPSKNEVLKVLALARLMDPRRANVVVTTALETLDPSTRKEGLLGGANSVMLNLTPLEYRRLYSIYPHRAHEEEEIRVQIEDTLALLRSIGRAPADIGINFKDQP